MYNIKRINYKNFPDELQCFCDFSDFLEDDTYLFLRTYGNEGDYLFDKKLNPFENQINATMDFINKFLTKDVINNFCKKLEKENYCLIPVQGFKYLGLEDKVYKFRYTGISSNLISIICCLKIFAETGLYFDFSISQKTKFTRNASSNIHRICFPTDFCEGNIKKSLKYIVFDDHVYSGSTISNLIGYIDRKGGVVEKILCLAKNPIVKELKLTKETLKKLLAIDKEKAYRDKFKDFFGFGFEYLTEVEAKILLESFYEKELNLEESINNYIKNPNQKCMFNKTSKFPKFKKADISLEKIGLKGFRLRITK